METEILQILPLLIPLLLIDLGMRIYVVIQIFTAKEKEIKIRWSPIGWILIVLLVNFGWVFFLIFGKEE